MNTSGQGGHEPADGDPAPSFQSGAGRRHRRFRNSNDKPLCIISGGLFPVRCILRRSFAGHPRFWEAARCAYPQRENDSPPWSWLPARTRRHPDKRRRGGDGVHRDRPLRFRPVRFRIESGFCLIPRKGSRCPSPKKISARIFRKFFERELPALRGLLRPLSGAPFSRLSALWSKGHPCRALTVS